MNHLDSDGMAMSGWRFLVCLMFLFAPLTARGYNLEGSVTGQFEAWPETGVIQFKNLKVENGNTNSYEVCGMDVSLVRDGTSKVDSGFTNLTDKPLVVSGSVFVGSQRFLIKFPKDLTGHIVYVRAYVTRTKGMGCPRENYFFGYSQDWPSASKPASAVPEAPSAVQGEALDMKAKKFLVENLSRCRHHNGELSDVSLSAERLALVDTDIVVTRWEVDLRGAKTTIDSVRVEIVCGSGNCARLSKASYSKATFSLQCGSDDFAGSIKRALDAYIRSLPAAPTF